MIGILAPEEIDAMLRRHRVGRLACSVNDRPYVVPITYAYDGGSIYAYSAVGRKVDVMREQPLVCFEIDETSGPSNWKSVVAEGIYEELTEEPGRSAAVRLLLNGKGDPVARGIDGSAPIVLFRIRPLAVTGRFERRDA